MTDTTNLYDAAAELLVKSAEVLAATPAGAPRFQYVSHGPPAYDCCDTLTVHAGMVSYSPLRRTPTTSTARDPRVPVVPQVGLTVTALRCASAQPRGGIQIALPTIAKILADSATVYADGWCLFNGLNRAYHKGTLFADAPCRIADIAAAVPIAPEGGCLGWSVLVTVELPGFDPLP